jgi:hypothetical protein
MNFNFVLTGRVSGVCEIADSWTLTNFSMTEKQGLILYFLIVILMVVIATLNRLVYSRH